MKKKHRFHKQHRVQNTVRIASEQNALKSGAATLLVRLLMLAAAAVGFLLCLISVYDLTLPMSALFRITLGITAAAFFAAAIRRRGWLIVLLIALAGVFAWKHAELLVQGWLLLIEAALQPMELELPSALLQLIEPVLSEDAQQRMLYAVGSLLAVLLPCMAAWTVSGTSAAGLLFCVLPPLLPGLIAGLVPPLFPSVLLLVVCLMLASYRSTMHAAKDMFSDEMQDDAVIESQQRGAWLTAALCMVPIALLTLLLSTRALPEAEYERPAYADKLREAFLNLDFASLLDAYNDGLSHGDLTNLSDIRFTGDAAIAVRASERHQLYLSGYTAAYFTGTNWEMANQSEYRAAAVGFSDPLPQNLHAAIAKDVEPYTVSVRNVDAEANAVYLPNGLATPADAIDGASLRQDGALNGSEQTASAGYTVEAISFTAVPSAPQSVGTLEASYLAAAKRAAEHADASVQRAAENYTAYVTETYTQLPDDVRLTAEQLCATYGLSLDEANGVYDIAALCRAVREVLRSNCRYSYTPQHLPDGADFATWFLQQAREGYCVHFATTAAVLLRSLGVPTRYAEGYIVIRSDYDKPTDADGYVLIEDTHAHAWTEVFDPLQLVWVPVEMTPSAADTAAPTQTPESAPNETPQPTDAPQDTEDAQQTAEETPSPTEEPAQLPQQGEEQTEATEQTNDMAELPTAEETLPQSPEKLPSAVPERKASSLFAAILIGLLFIGGGAAGCMLLKKRRQARFAQADANAAILAVCRSAQSMLHFADCPSRALGQSVEQYAAFLVKERPWLDDMQLARLLLLGERAAFSQHACTGAERTEAIRLLRQLQTRMAEALPPYKRMIFRLRFC